MTEARGAIATEGPCRGHICDGCGECRRGRCCRKDRPDDRRPSLGEWDGPIFGRLGTLTVEDGRLMCHCCGRTFRNLACHARMRHGLSADEYRAVFGLRAKTKLWSQDLKARARAIHLPRLSRYWGVGGVALFTPEERSRYSLGTHWALEALQDPRHAEVRRQAARKGSATQQRRIAEGTLVRPQPKSPDPAATRAKIADRLRALWKDPAWRARTVTRIKAGQYRAGFSGSPEGTAPRPCIVCGTPFVSRTGRSTCSDACEDRRRRASRGVRKPRLCRVCQTPFDRPTNRRYCSEECAEAAAKARPPLRMAEDARQRLSARRLQGRLALAPVVAAALAAGGEALLSPRDREMVARFYGLADGRVWPPADLQAAYRMTDAGVRRAVRKAVERILGETRGGAQADTGAAPVT